MAADCRRDLSTSVFKKLRKECRLSYEEYSDEECSREGYSDEEWSAEGCSDEECSTEKCSDEECNAKDATQRMSR